MHHLKDAAVDLQKTFLAAAVRTVCLCRPLLRLFLFLLFLFVFLFLLLLLLLLLWFLSRLFLFLFLFFLLLFSFLFFCSRSSCSVETLHTPCLRPCTLGRGWCPLHLLLRHSHQRFLEE